MCGIAGFVGVVPTKQEVHILSCWNETRGTDSYGVFDGKTLYKQTGSYTENIGVLDRVRFERPVVILHCRARSVGPVNIECCQPIASEEKTRILAHNGTISITINPYSSDSIYLCNKYDDFDFSTYSGSIAFLTYDLKKKVFEVFHGFSDNKEERPLYVGKLRGGLVFSSIELSLYSIGCTNVKEVKHNIIYKYNTKGKIIGHRKIERRKVHTYGTYTPTRTYGYYSDLYDDLDDDTFNRNYPISTSTTLEFGLKNIEFNQKQLIYTKDDCALNGPYWVKCGSLIKKFIFIGGRCGKLIPFVNKDNEYINVCTRTQNVFKEGCNHYTRTTSTDEDKIIIQQILSNANQS